MADRHPASQKTEPVAENVEKPREPTLPAEGRQHTAVYTSDNKKGGYLIKVVGPHANAFTGRIIPVTTRAGVEHDETLGKLVWTGIDSDSPDGRVKGTGKPCALYYFKSTPRGEDEITF